MNKKDGQNGRSLVKVEVRGGSDQSMVQLDVSSFRNWTVTYQTGQFDRLKFYRLRKWTVADQSGR